MMTLYDLDNYVRLQRRAKPRKRPVPPPVASNGSSKGKSAAKALARSRAFASLTRPRAVAFARPLDYEVPGVVSEVRQPSSMSCWATAYAILVDWRDQRSTPIADSLRQVGQRWVDLFNANTGSTAEDEALLFAAAGLVAEPLKNPTLEGWEGLLRQYGPLSILIDVDPSTKRAMHWLVMTGIHGDGTVDGTTVTIVDPLRGDKRPVKFSDFRTQYEDAAARRTKSGRFNQIVHWPKDVKFAGAKPARAFGGNPTPAPNAPAPAPSAAQPWSHYFHFRKGAKFDVDGPLNYNGSGEVLERTADYLKFTMKMPAVSIFGHDIPRADMVLEATYKKEGKGNLVRGTINGVAVEDANAEIVSNGTKRTIRPVFSGGVSPVPEWITVTPDGKDEIDLDMKIDGRDVDFDLELTSGSVGLALGIEPWSRSFPFAKGTQFKVDGPMDYNGTGQVVERTDTVLKFSMNMPKAMVADALDLLVDLTYAGEGAGNTLVMTINGEKFSDTNTSITTDLVTYRRTIVHNLKFASREVGRISFGPSGKDGIDLRVVVDKKEHRFDLERMAAAQSWTRELTGSPKIPTRTSTVADGLAEVSAFAGRTGATRWKLSRPAVAARLKDLISNPDLVNQGGLNLCGPAAFFHVYAGRDPQAFARYAADLFEKGSGALGSLTITPGDDLVKNDYARIAAKMSDPTPPAEWMCLGALRDSENVTFDFEGTPEESISGMTTPGELASWMQKCRAYSKVRDEGNWVRTKGISHALGLGAPAPNQDVLLLINARMLPNVPAGKKKLLDGFPNHFIHLLSKVERTARGIEFDYWTWGGRPPRAVINPSTFADNYYGAVIGEV